MNKKLNIFLAGPRGFCAGVDRAIEMVKEALNDAPPFAFSTLRFSIALLCTLIPIIYQFKKFSKQEVYGGILCGILLHAGYAFQNYGLQLTSASKSAFITGTSILIVPLDISIISTFNDLAKLIIISSVTL